MGKKLKEVDAYIDDAADFAKPILKKLRRLFHKAAPQADEVIKWGIPYYEYNGLVGGMAAFKKHVSIGFWKSKEMKDPNKLFKEGPKASMCNVKFAGLDDLPSDAVMIKYMKAAVRLNEPAVVAASAKKAKSSIKKKTPKPKVPAVLSAALAKKKKAKSFFNELSPSCQRDYVEWITEAKREATVEKRVKTTVEWLSDGKKRNWKYQ